jgi:predicted dehydrogenase
VTTAKVEPMRIGVLGCASVVDYALVAPSRAERTITVAAVASRGAAKAEQFARERGNPPRLRKL